MEQFKDYMQFICLIVNVLKRLEQVIYIVHYQI